MRITPKCYCWDYSLGHLTSLLCKFDHELNTEVSEKSFLSLSQCINFLKTTLSPDSHECWLNVFTSKKQKKRRFKALGETFLCVPFRKRKETRKHHCIICFNAYSYSHLSTVPKTCYYNWLVFFFYSVLQIRSLLLLSFFFHVSLDFILVKIQIFFHLMFNVSGIRLMIFHKDNADEHSFVDKSF